MTHYENPSPEAEDRMATSERKRWEKEQARKKMEIDDAAKLYELVKDLPTEWTPPKQLKKKLAPMISRVRAIANKVPNLEELHLTDSLKREWELNINRFEENNSVSLGGRRSYDGVNEGFYFSDDHITYVNYHGVIGWPDNNEVAIFLVNKRLDELLPSLEKSLGLRKK